MLAAHLGRIEARINAPRAPDRELLSTNLVHPHGMMADRVAQQALANLTGVNKTRAARHCNGRKVCGFDQRLDVA